MIEIKRVTDGDLIKHAGDIDDGDIFFAAFEAGKMTGYCRCRHEGSAVILIDLFEQNGDIVLADAMARASVAGCHGADTVECGGDSAFLKKYCESTGRFVDGVTEVRDFLKKNCE